MKFAIFALVCFLSTFVAADTEQELGLDWDKIEPLNIYVEPIGPAPAVPGGRIIGGSVATRNGIPYIVALIINQSGFCGGSIISRTTVLTAAHCVDTANNVQVIAGAHNPRTTVNEPAQVRLFAASRIVHNAWNRNTLQNDVAVLRVNAIPVGQTGISQVALAPPTSGTFAGSTAILAGWGRTTDSSSAIANELRTVQLPIIANALCQQSFGSVNAQHICTSGQGRRGACNGDSGGPLVVNGVEVGIVSFGATQCEAQHPSVFARVSFFHSWIQDNSA